ncbi:CPBP family intramembrane metalloprotease [Epibacterium ulvae]|nr:CPBP family intramembrane metalloprotease [Epibacterium ulvae]
MYILAPRYGAHEGLVAPARPHAAIWRIVAGLVLVAVVSLAGTKLFIDLVAAMSPGLSAPHEGKTPGAMLVLLFSFVFVSIGVVLAARLFHHRSELSLFGPLPLFFRQFRRTLAGLFLLWVVITLSPPYGVSVPLEPNLDMGHWVRLLPLALLGVFAQVEAEELLFRGYIQQALAARFSTPWVWMVLPSAVFALGHYLPAEAGDNALLIAIWAGLFGVLMADLTARAGSLGPAVAVHLVNNVVALLIVGSPSSLNGLALHLVPFELSDSAQIRPWLWVDFAMMVVSWLVARLAIRA